MSRALARYRAAVAVELLLAGHSYDNIAAELGFADRSGAWRAVMRALDRRTVEAVDHYRQHQLAELQMVYEKAWPAAMAGNLGATAAVLRATEARLRLLGL